MSQVTRNFIQALETPSDINEHLLLLYSLAARSNTLVELGVRQGLSSAAFIAARPDSLVSYDIELLPEAVALFEAGKAEGVNCELVQGSSFDIELPEVDSIFIDTDHTFACLSKELKLHGNKAQKYLAFHDTVSFASELMPAIIAFMDMNPQWETFIECKHNNGLLVLTRTK